jgi:hypothetical protein
MKMKSRLRMSLIGAGTVVGEGSFSHICHGGNRHCVVTLKLWGSTPCGLPNCRTDCAVAQELTLQAAVLANVCITDNDVWR